MQIGISVLNKKNRMANSADPDEMANYEPSHVSTVCRSVFEDF